MKPTIKLTRHEFSKCPIVNITLRRQTKETINVEIHSEHSRLDIHKIEVRPSCAVNPPWIQYFRGVSGCCSYHDGEDRRAKVIKSEILTALDVRNDRGEKHYTEATWKEYRAVCSTVNKALKLLDSANKGSK